MWTTRLLILGLVRWLQPVHGYDVRRELLSWGVEQWVQIKPGSIYHGLKRLTKDGLLEVASTEQVDNRPARTSYRVTAAGEEEFQTLLRAKLWDLECGFDPFSVAWSFAPTLNPREASAMMRNRAKLLRDKAEANSAVLEATCEDPRSKSFMPPHVRSWMTLQIEVTMLHVDWCERTADEIDTGKIPTGQDYHPDDETVRNWKEHIQTLDAYGKPRPRPPERGDAAA
ncbi:MAG: PadR family transcriptional regulator [Stackebrandtia sp.]